MDFKICSRLLIKVALTELDDSTGNLNVKWFLNVKTRGNEPCTVEYSVVTDNSGI